jgi:hypothetical protein
LSLLLCLFDDKLGSLGILLSNLFLLDSGGELFSEAKMYELYVITTKESAHVMWV